MNKQETAARLADMRQNGRGVSLRDAVGDLAGVSDVLILAYTEYNGRRVPCGFGDDWAEKLNVFLDAATEAGQTYTLDDTLP